MKKIILLTILILSIWLTGCSLTKKKESPISNAENNNKTKKNVNINKEIRNMTEEERRSMPAFKPIIYLYPESEQEISVKLPIKGEFLVTYPQISPENERKVLAKPNGTLINKDDNREYSYLFREANLDTKRTPDEGFIVKKEDTVFFLQEKLAYLGLTPREYNEFIVYWWPLMMKNSWNQISFLEEEYSDFAPLEISPNPDSIQRVFMTFKGLEAPVEIKEQKLKPFTRTGFSVIERGGTELK